MFGRMRFMSDARLHQVTRLLNEWGAGNELALEQLMPVIYDELRSMARRFMNRQGDHTWQTTELIHEAYLKLAKQDEPVWQNRSHFFGVASTVMRHLLVDHARTKNSQKRGGGMLVTLDESAPIPIDSDAQIISLNEALEQLSKLDERKCRVVEMKFFGGLEMHEIADVLRVSVGTVERDWRFSRNWLLKEISRN